jgi:hypothetical protein
MAALQSKLWHVVIVASSAAAVLLGPKPSAAGSSINGLQRNGNGVELNGVRMNGAQLEGTPASGGKPAIAGTTLAATGPDGAALPMVIVKRSNDGISYKGKFYRDNKDVWWNVVHWGIAHAPNKVGEKMPATSPNACVSKVVTTHPECGTSEWTASCVKAARKICTAKKEKPYLHVAYGEPICGTDEKGIARQAIFIGGEWDDNSGTQGAGGKALTADSGAISIGCRRVGAIAKCVSFGYKPWVSKEMDELHQACVRMVRADFCGDGTAWTVDGNLIDIEDVFRIQKPQSTDFVFEATWSKNGAAFLNTNLDFRTAKWAAHMVSPHTGGTFADYQKTHPYCQPKRVTKLNTEPPATPIISTAPLGSKVSTPTTFSLDDVGLNHTDSMLRTRRPAKCPTDQTTTCPLGL